jgi:defect-in-organelle-trafficking protein DotA
MLVLNVFLRPSMMIFGFIFGIILSYVGTWLINTGFGIVLNDIYNLGGPSESGETSATRNISSTVGGIAAVGAGVATGGVAGLALAGAGGSAIGGGQAKTYSQWTGLYMYFFSLVLYTSMYVAVVQKSFTLIYMLPDKILRWLSGGQQESLGEGVAGGMQKEVKDEVAKGEKATDSGLQQLNSAAKQGGDSASSAGSMSAGG